MDSVDNAGGNGGGLRDRLRPVLAPWRARIEDLAARSASNAVSLRRIVAARQGRRPANYPALPWPVALWNVLMLVVGAALLLDQPVASFNGHWPAWLFGAADSITDIGLSGWYLIPAFVVLVAVNLTDWHDRPRRKLLALYNWTSLAMLTLASVGLSGLAVNVVKYGFGRSRPAQFQDLGAYFFDAFANDARYASFPSGHATTLGAVAGILILLFPRARYIIAPALIWLAATRVVVGAHYPSDVVAGLAFGFASTMLAAVVFARLGYIFIQKPAGLPTVKKTFWVLW